METLILILHVLAALCVIGLVLLQHGKGADVGAAFGGGVSGSLFGATGAANFLSRTTAILAAVFFVTSLGLTYFATHKTEAKGVIESRKALEKSAAPSEQVPQPANEPAPSTAPAPAPASGPVPADSGSKANEVPK